MNKKNLLIISIFIIWGLYKTVVHYRVFPYSQIISMKAFLENGSRKDRVDVFSDIEGREDVNANLLKNKDTMVLLAFGQSNIANNGETRYKPKNNVYNYYNKKCYKAKEPLLGATGKGGNPCSRLGDMIVKNNLYKNVLLVPLGVGGSSIKRWATSGSRINSLLIKTITELQESGFTITHILWHQGETDREMGTKKEDYKRMFLSIVNDIRNLGVEAPIYVAIATRYGNRISKDVQEAQLELGNMHNFGLYRGANTDILKSTNPGPYRYPPYRFDGAHFSDIGLTKHAELWLEILKEARR